MDTKLTELKDIFSTSLNIAADTVKDSLEYNTIPEWDSVAHMTLISALEEKYDIMFETQDILDMSTFGKAQDILKNYDINVVAD